MQRTKKEKNMYMDPHVTKPINPQDTKQRIYIYIHSCSLLLSSNGYSMYRTMGMWSNFYQPRIAKVCGTGRSLIWSFNYVQLYSNNF